MIDINNDGHIDLAGSRSPDALYNSEPIIYFNDGAGRFEIKAVGPEINIILDLKSMISLT